MLRRTPSACGRRALLAASAVVLWLASPSAARATVVKAMSLLEKTEASPLVVFALVERVESEWEIPDARIQTWVTVRILEVIKGEGAPGDHVILRQSGGEIGQVHQAVAGMSRYEPGEEVVLFLEPLGAYVVEIGIGIGRYGVETNGREKWVTHNPKVAGVRFQTGQPMRIEPIAPMTPEPLDRFLKRVRSYALGIPTEIARPRKGVHLQPVLEIKP